MSKFISKYAAEIAVISIFIWIIGGVVIPFIEVFSKLN